MRIGRTMAVAVVILGAGGAVAAGQGSVPTVTVTASATAVTASPAPVAPGATRFEFVTSGLQRATSVYLAAPKPGLSNDQVIAALRANPDAGLEQIDIVASANLEPGGSRAITVEIEPNRSYLLVNDLGRENPQQWIFAPLATGGAPTGATAPDPDATVVMRDLRFGGASRLPRDGTIRVTNVGWAPHFALAAPLKAGVRRARAARALRSGSDREVGRVLNFRNSFELASLLTRGAVTDQEITFNRRGRWALVCFFEGHDAQGMYRIVRVR
jgi:uncharacterized cupredoxin-like copper-binding protein